MTHALFPDNDPPNRRKIKRPKMSDADGTREGGLVFVIVFIVGFILATVAHPAAITSFWVWFFLLTMCAAIAVGVQKGVAHLYGHVEDGEDDA
ncbi:hypothetical protein [uncultured Tateyamaria sp.]|uniref:hypothetical protein n=1 Tax=uncultured Tateyamaria sp. TaxID=455651 RepID=UPI0026151952|nr:hypothetical protein [uncultured Tateyamaria sp.]